MLAIGNLNYERGFLHCRRRRTNFQRRNRLCFHAIELSLNQ